MATLVSMMRLENDAICHPTALMVVNMFEVEVQQEDIKP